jgi:Protein of unknown function (DUF1549)/Protein of unknown function (DUF1501)
VGRAGGVRITHWAFEPPRKSDLPAVKDAGWPRNPIDRFFLARLEAEATTLIRRVYLDLTGLSPTPRDVDAFLADSTDKSYEMLVYRLLDSPRYNVVENPAHIHDLNATILHCLGIDHRRLSFKFQGLDMRLTGVEEHSPIKGILV